MKKIYSILVLVAFALGTVACSSDDNSSNSNILGEWKEVKTSYLDKDKKVIREELSTNEECGPDEMEFKSDVVIYKYPYKDYQTKECVFDTDQDSYSISGKKITVKYEDDGEVISSTIDIIELSSSKLVIETNDIYEEYTDGTIYIRTEYSKK